MDGDDSRTSSDEVLLLDEPTDGIDATSLIVEEIDITAVDYEELVIVAA